MTLRVEVSLGPGHIVLDSEPASVLKKGAEPPIFVPFLLSPNGWMDQDSTWYGGRPRPRRLCVRWRPSYSQNRGHTHHHPVFGPCLLWPNGWMDEDATWYGSRPRPRRIVLDGSQFCAKRAQQPPIFSACVYCGHGRPSQLLLSSC